MEEINDGSVWRDGDGNEAEVVTCDGSVVSFSYTDQAGAVLHLSRAAFLSEFMLAPDVRAW